MRNVLSPLRDLAEKERGMRVEAGVDRRLRGERACYRLKASASRKRMLVVPKGPGLTV